MNTTEDFRHERLKLSGNFMRLIQIQGGTKQDVISLRITQYAIHRLPKYAAISYTWGPIPRHAKIASSSPVTADPYTRAIRVNGRPFRIRVNLWNLLYHLRQRGESRFLWVDALCIDQENLEERNFHVYRMSKVYENAEKTIVWLGLPSDDRRQARVLEFIHEMAVFCRKHTTEMGMRMFREKYLAEGLVQRWSNVLELCRGTYWSRTWILQEFIQASNIEVLCGIASLDGKDLEDVVRTIRSIIQPSASAVVQGPPLPAFIHKFTQTIPFRLTSRRVSHTESTLEDLLAEFYDSRCTERRDKIYGILGIADDYRPDEQPSTKTVPPSYPGPLQPDYSKDILEVYFEVVRYLMQPPQPRKRSPMQAIFLAQRALGITQADVESYMAMMTIRNPNMTLGQRLAELSCPLVPDYVHFIDDVLPGWTSIRDLRQRLELVDWSKYVGHEVRRKSSSRPPAPPHKSSNASTTSTGSGMQYVRAPLPSDMIDNVIQAATHNEELSHLYNYSSPSPGCSIPIPHILSHQHDKRTHNNPALIKPSIIIESNPTLGIDPVRIGFACTDVRPGDVICQFTGLDTTLIARRIGSSHELQLIGLAKMVTHSALLEKSVHPSCKKHEYGRFSSVVMEEDVDGNGEGWTMVTDPISLWEVLRRS
ncbi:hypothetical protein H2200_006328 [Cladophialophora chaetospira]|uniref:Heterokaryon incompatibility domain-containing protein n=1 Tax=Cladophialophora chaetospira TaxID=386627 RepID=A0AA38XAU3_9EURO|nr:hypothetical protein H2200_006328 [Cladophialophora chaetospira]